MTEGSGEFYRLRNEFLLADSYHNITHMNCARTADLALEAWIKLENFRKQNLLEILDRENLAICDQYHQELGDQTPLGIIPKSSLQIIYKDFLPVAADEFQQMIEESLTPGGKFTRIKELSFRCTQHSNPNPNIEWPFSAEEGNRNFQSEVFEKDQRYITRLHNLDITDRVNAELAGRHFEEPVFRHFNLPELPAQPKTHHRD